MLEQTSLGQYSFNAETGLRSTLTFSIETGLKDNIKWRYYTYDFSNDSVIITPTTVSNNEDINQRTNDSQELSVSIATINLFPFYSFDPERGIVKEIVKEFKTFFNITNVTLKAVPCEGGKCEPSYLGMNTFIINVQ